MEIAHLTRQEVASVKCHIEQTHGFYVSKATPHHVLDAKVKAIAEAVGLMAIVDPPKRNILHDDNALSHDDDSSMDEEKQRSIETNDNVFDSRGGVLSLLTEPPRVITPRPPPAKTPSGRTMLELSCKSRKTLEVATACEQKTGVEIPSNILGQLQNDGGEPMVDNKQNGEYHAHALPIQSCQSTTYESLSPLLGTSVAPFEIEPIDKVFNFEEWTICPSLGATTESSDGAHCMPLVNEAKTDPPSTIQEVATTEPPRQSEVDTTSGAMDGDCSVYEMPRITQRSDAMSTQGGTPRKFSQVGTTTPKQAQIVVGGVTQESVPSIVQYMAMLEFGQGTLLGCTAEDPHSILVLHATSEDDLMAQCARGRVDLVVFVVDNHLEAAVPKLELLMNYVGQRVIVIGGDLLDDAKTALISQECMAQGVIYFAPVPVDFNELWLQIQHFLDTSHQRFILRHRPAMPLAMMHKAIHRRGQQPSELVKAGPRMAPAMEADKRTKKTWFGKDGKLPSLRYLASKLSVRRNLLNASGPLAKLKSTESHASQPDGTVNLRSRNALPPKPSVHPGPSKLLTHPARRVLT
ncbi:Aste57867_11128 [Aphanomyces stellatus]|uniref:Aste57867_11128 protein n=1 Tax=Aphanomyces stellatus TaxID=120398 RepID=A0A485KS19_9STRA|nr:hypothetical protein As57867_011086 [Aphanomyces stellatus]VFT87995.1 Aste57867_11128 [Aphanomyces stellatus]